MQNTFTYYIGRCGLFEGASEEPYVERLDGEDDPLVAEADAVFWTLYRRDAKGFSTAIADYATHAEAQAALLEFMDVDDGPQLSDPLGDSPITISEFFASYVSRYAK